MPSKLVTLAAVGALTLGGAAVAGTALAATGGGTPSPASAPSYAAPSPRPNDDAARAERIKQALAGLVADKTLTQAQADKVASTLAASGVGAGPGRGPRVLGGGPALGAAAKALGMTRSDLLTQLRSGKSLAAVATDKGVDVQKVVDALVGEAKQRLADAVKSGRLTQAQADQRLKNLTARITAKVNATRPEGPGRFGPGGPGRWHGPANAPSSPSPSA